jgi:hypothetical protein
MLKGIRSVAVAFTVCFAMAAGAQGSVTIGKDGNIQINKGNKEVTIEGGKINVQKGDKKVEIEGSEVKVQTADDEDGTSATLSAGTVETSGSMIEINGSGRNETIRCGPKSHVDINGAGHTLELIGECDYVEVNGTGNRVNVEAAATIEVNGTSNTVTWKRGVGAAKPKVSRDGLNNKVSQAK